MHEHSPYLPQQGRLCDSCRACLSKQWIPILEHSEMSLRKQTNSVFPSCVWHWSAVFQKVVVGHRAMAVWHRAVPCGVAGKILEEGYWGGEAALGECLPQWVACWGNNPVLCRHTPLVLSIQAWQMELMDVHLYATLLQHCVMSCCSWLAIASEYL